MSLRRGSRPPPLLAFLLFLRDQRTLELEIVAFEGWGRGKRQTNSGLCFSSIPPSFTFKTFPPRETGVSHMGRPRCCRRPRWLFHHPPGRDLTRLPVRHLPPLFFFFFLSNPPPPCLPRSAVYTRVLHNKRHGGELGGHGGDIVCFMFSASNALAPVTVGQLERPIVPHPFS